MAGSYNHCVTDDGKLRTESFVDLIENLGDAWEAIEEMYGMIWLLAGEGLTRELSLGDPADRVEDAQQRYQQGLEISPGLEAR